MFDLHQQFACRCRNTSARMRRSLTCISWRMQQSLGNGAIREKGELRCGQPFGR
jgi:hypothetical protein